MSLSTEAADVFTDALDDVGVPIVANGVTRQCIAPTITRGKAMELDGYVDEQTSEAWLLRSDFTALGLADRSPVNVDGVNFLIVTYEDESIAPTIKLNLRAVR